MSGAPSGLARITGLISHRHALGPSGPALDSSPGMETDLGMCSFTQKKFFDKLNVEEGKGMAK